VSITVDLTYDLAKALGIRRFEVEAPATLQDVVRLTRTRFQGEDSAFDKLTRVTGFVVNGVLISHGRGMDTPLKDKDRVSFLKAAAGG
jgi:molybdopterin converting factor small subunit